MYIQFFKVCIGLEEFMEPSYLWILWRRSSPLTSNKSGWLDTLAKTHEVADILHVRALCLPPVSWVITGMPLVLIQAFPVLSHRFINHSVKVEKERISSWSINDRTNWTRSEFWERSPVQSLLWGPKYLNVFKVFKAVITPEISRDN